MFVEDGCHSEIRCERQVINMVVMISELGG